MAIETLMPKTNCKTAKKCWNNEQLPYQKIRAFKFMLRVFLSILAIVGIPMILFATKDPEVSERFDGAAAGIFVGAYKEVKDPVFYTSQQQYIEDITKDKYTNTIALYINDASVNFIQTDFTYTATLRVTYEDLIGSSHTIPDFNLNIYYKIGQGQKYDARQYYYFSDARKVKVEIIALDKHGATWNVEQVLRIDNRLVATREYKFFCTNTVAFDSKTPTSDELNIHWTSPSDGGATHFDVEWVWIDNDAIEKYKNTINNQLQLDARLIFKRNATRVTIPKSSTNYVIPLLYDGEGKLFYRIRPVQYREDGNIVEGKWNVVDVVSANDYQDYLGHENNQLNWQASTSFAEEGKRKSVIQYFDGTLRVRQTVTKDNSTPDKNTVVAETYYDYQGRPAINILPAPTLSTVISYARNFNKFQTTQEYPKDVYDLLSVNQSVCNTSIPPLDNNFGTAKYYSPNNPLVAGTQNNFDKYIPDAEGYPYTETRYSPDGTGRIAEQSGVGPEHKLGSSHQTKYFYGSSDQKELDALFGTEVGNASHYFKNMVRDANGQYSVSYVDMHGRTIATALAGNPPTNLNALPSYTGALKYLTKDLLTPQNNLVQGRSVVSSSTLLVANAGLHDFRYTLSPLSAEIIACNPQGQTVCYDCYYDLEIKITDGCGNEVKNEIRRNFSFGNYDQSCTELPPSFDVNMPGVFLAEGEYNITKTLTVSKHAQDWYRENVFKQKNICTTLQQFINNTYAILLGESDCDNMTCASCTTAVGTYEQFKARFLQSQGLPPTATVPYENEIRSSWEQSLAHCQILCTQVETQLDLIKAQMLEDMSPPMGQYARINIDLNGDNDFDDVIPGTPYPTYENGLSRPYNILRSTSYPNPNPITIMAPYYKKPLDENDNTPTREKYKTNSNEIDPLAYEANGNVISNVEEFTERFDDSWAKSLLVYHPEYAKLKYAEANLKPSYSYSAALDNIETWQDALNAGYLGSNGAAIVNADPFFNGVGANLKSTMIGFVNTMHRNGSFWKLAYLSVACLADNSLNCSITAPNALNPSSALIASRCTADKNYMWNVFRSLYVTIKDSMVNARMNNLVNGAIYTNLNTYQYERRFGHYEDYYKQSDFIKNIITRALNDVQEPAQPEMDAEYEDNCESYIIYWENELSKCDVLQGRPDREAITNQITLVLRQICVEGSDEDHPLGSSSVKPSSPYNPRRFEDAIQAIFLQHNIAVSALCHPFMIDYPRPYEQQPPLNDETIMDMHDKCVCDKLTNIKAAMEAAGWPTTPGVIHLNMKAYLKNTYGLDVSEVLLDKLIRGCNGTLEPNCTTYDPPLVVPAFLADCKPLSQNCINCKQYLSLKQSFKFRFNPVFNNVIIANPQTEAEVRQNEAFEAYMNISTGFNKRWQEYLAFETSICTNASTVWNCTTLDSILTAFHTYSGDTLSGVNCEQAFSEFFNNIFNSTYSFAQINSIYKEYCGANNLNVCQLRIGKSDVVQLSKDFYYEYGSSYWQNPAWQTTFTNYFNQRYSINYSTSAVFTAVSSLCGSKFIICGQFSAARLWVLDSTYRNNNYNLAWLSATCEQSFANYFNAQTQSNLVWEELVSLYDDQGIDLRACAPPISCEILQQLNYTYQNLGEQACSPQIPLGTPNYCKNCYTHFINQQLSTSYTYEQIALMMQRSCGVNNDNGLVGSVNTNPMSTYSISPCGNGFECDTLSAFSATFLNLFADSIGSGNCRNLFTQKFNEYFATAYSFSEVTAIYLLNCNVAPPICEEVQITEKEQVNKVYEDFVTLYPYPAGQFGLECQSKFVQYFNQNFSSNYTYNEIVNYYITLSGSMPDVCAVSNSADLEQFKADYLQVYGSYTMPRILTNDLFTELYNREFKPKHPYTWFEIVDIFAIANIPLNIYSTDNTSTLTCSKLPGVKKAFSTIQLSKATVKTEKTETTSGEIFIDLSNTSEEETSKENQFVAFFNLYFNTAYTYNQILEYAVTECGLNDYQPIAESSEAELVLINNGDSSNIAVTPKLCGRVEPHTILPPPADGPCDYLLTMALNIATEQYNVYLTKQYDDFDKRYLEKCLEAKNFETFTVTAPVAEYHYTLYYYDQAGNLIKTVPPAGVNADFSTTFLQDVKTARQNCQTVGGACVSITPPHTLKTQYRYNSLNQVVAQMSPDGGESYFWYDRLGRLVVSQNAKQKLVNKYSYTLYDNLGRIKEVGEKPNGQLLTQAITQNESSLTAWLANGGNNKEQITRTTYDEIATNINPPPAPAALEQKNLRNRVSYSQVFDIDPGDIVSFNHSTATYYSYDIHGNVDKLLQDYKSTMGTNSGNRFKLITYSYDLISGKVNEVAYQPNMRDAYYHRYVYDAENKLTEVYASRDKLYEERKATYSYYRHGPLARTVLGQRQVQGIDYAYNLQGWLKGVNSTSVNDGTFDIGLDGKTVGGSIPPQVARDAYSFSLNYYANDYKPINNTVTPFVQNTFSLTNTQATLTAPPLYNGNIASMFVNIPQIGTAHLYGYQYDQLNRIKAMDAFKGFDNTTNNWITTPQATADYLERVSYDANGNILTYKRNGNAINPAGVAMDDMTYEYIANSNKLKKVSDVVAGTNYGDDIDNQTDANNYVYDEIGNLIQDKAEKTDIEWNVYGKISKIYKGDLPFRQEIEYKYDVSGNRIQKIVYPPDRGFTKITHYVRDASGNVMSIYSEDPTINGGQLTQTEISEYGSSRLGVINSNLNVSSGLLATDATGISTFTIGNELFELSNHLGNVLVTVSDKKIAVPDPNNSTQILYYTADVITANDYYPFGMQMPNRKYAAANGYRYGFNGKENDNEVKGEGNQQDYGMRIYDVRLGRFLSLDPLQKEYPELTPYQFASNRPIDGIDMDGMEYTPAGRYGFDQRAVDATAVQHYPLDPLMIAKQQAASEAKQKVETQRMMTREALKRSHTVMTQQRELTPEQKQRNASLAANYKATHPQIPEWQNSKTYNKFAENLALPIITMAAGEGVGNLAFKGASYLLKGTTTNIYRTIDAGELISLNNKKFSFAPNGTEMKQFWLNESAYNTYIKAAEGRFANGFKLEVKVPKSIIGEGNILNTSTQVDNFLFDQGAINSATINSQKALDLFNKAVKKAGNKIKISAE